MVTYRSYRNKRILDDFNFFSQNVANTRKWEGTTSRLLETGSQNQHLQDHKCSLIACALKAWSRVVLWDRWSLVEGQRVIWGITLKWDSILFLSLFATWLPWGGQTFTMCFYDTSFRPQSSRANLLYTDALKLIQNNLPFKLIASYQWQKFTALF